MKDQDRTAKAKEAILGTKTTFPPDKEMDDAERARAKREEARGRLEERVTPVREFKAALGHVAELRNILSSIDRSNIWRAYGSDVSEWLPQLDSMARRLKNAIESA